MYTRGFSCIMRVKVLKPHVLAGQVCICTLGPLMTDMLTLRTEQTMDANDTAWMRAVAKPQLFDADMIMATCSTHAECTHILCRSASQDQVPANDTQSPPGQPVPDKSAPLSTNTECRQSLLCHAQPPPLCAGTITGSAVRLAISSG